MENWTKDSIWRGQHGSKQLKNVDDTYLANILNFVNFYKPEEFQLIETLKEIQKERGLLDEFMNRSQIPYRNPSGNWEIWDFDNNRLIEVSKSVNERCTCKEPTGHSMGAIPPDYRKTLTICNKCGLQIKEGG